MPTTSASDLAEQLDAALTTTIYVDADLTDEQAADLLAAAPPLKVEFDQVRQLWSVRRATDEEVAEVAEVADAADEEVADEEVAEATSSEPATESTDTTQAFA